MIIAGTVSAYLKLSIDEFQTNMTTAMQLLERLGIAGQNCTGGFSLFERSAGSAAAAISGVMTGAFSALSTGMDGVNRDTNTAAASLSRFSSAASACSGSVASSAGSMSAAVSAAAGAVSAAFAGAAMTAGTSGAGITAAMAGAADGTAASMISVSSSVAGLSASQTTALNIANGIKKNILTPIQSLKEPLTSAMVDAGRGMANGLRSMESAVVGVARGIAERVRATIESSLEIASPSKVMRRIGAYTAEGLALGMEDMLPRVASGAAEIARTVERSSSAAVSIPAVSAYAAGAAPSASLSAGGMQESSTDLSALSERVDRLLDFLYDTEPVLRLDGRTFGRMVREYV